MSQGSAISLALESTGSSAIASKQRRLRVEAVVAAAERGGEIEAEAVDAAMIHPAPQRGDRHGDDRRAVEREAIAAAHVVDVARGIVGIEAEIGGVVEPAQRQRRAEFVALAVVVEHDVEDRPPAPPRAARRSPRAPPPSRPARGADRAQPNRTGL